MRKFYKLSGQVMLVGNRLIVFDFRTRVESSRGLRSVLGEKLFDFNNENNDKGLLSRRVNGGCLIINWKPIGGSVIVNRATREGLTGI